MENYVREIALIGQKNFEKLRAVRVAVFGIGGVGSYAAEALVRAGVGTIDFVDGDCVAASNLNRQLIALHSTLGKNKAEVMAARARDIDPAGNYTAYPLFFDQKTRDVFDFSRYSYVADCIDDVEAKALLLTCVREKNTPVISCMGAGNKLDGSAFRVADLEKTRECPLARIMRRKMKEAGVTGVRAVYSEEKPLSPDRALAAEGERLIGSLSFVPSAAGLLLAGEIVKSLIQ